MFINIIYHNLYKTEYITLFEEQHETSWYKVVGAIASKAIQSTM